MRLLNINKQQTHNTEGIRVKTKIRKQIQARKRKIQKRLKTPPSGRQSPELQASNIHYEIAERQQAISCGGIGLIHQMVNQLELAQQINRNVPLFKLVLLYTESDHVLNIAYNILAGDGNVIDPEAMDPKPGGR